MSKKNDEEIRKVQLTGGSTYTLSLPKWWVEEMEVGAGDGMLVREKGSTLMVSPAKLQEGPADLETEVRVRKGDSVEVINRKVLSLYLSGYNSINIVSEKDRLRSAKRNAVKNFVRRKLIGTEIISESIESISLQTLLSYSELSARGALKRMYNVVSSMQDNSLKALGNFDKELAHEVIQIDDEVDRFQMYLIREINAAVRKPSLLEKIGLETLNDCLDYRLVSKNIERVGDHSGKVAEYIVDMDEPLSKETVEKILDFSNKAISLFDGSVDSFFERDYESAEENIQKLNSIYKKEDEMNRYFAQTETAETLKGRLIMESIRRMAEYGCDIAEMVLNITVDLK